MKCPVCNRNLAPTLSICLTCGAMMNDSVREEHRVKVSTSGNLPKIEQNATKLPPPRPFLKPTNPYAVPPPASVVSAPVQRRVETAELSTPKTSQTLVDFQNKNTSIPEWRLQMQNAVRQRKGGLADDDSGISTQVVSAAQLRTHGATALKAETVPEPIILENADPRLNSALRRIADSRSSYLSEEPAKPAFASRNVQAKSFPLHVVAPNANAASRVPEINATAVSIPKPTLVAPFKLDTNKLPKLEETQVKIIEKVEEIDPVQGTMPPEFDAIKRIFINADNDQVEEDIDQIDSDEIEDLAPFSMRFNAGLFDFIIGTVVSMILLSPLALSGGNWFSISGLLIFAATCSIIMFTYLTTCVGFFGKTIGMRIFSLEVVDAEENEYPTLQQAAVHSSIYLASLALGGVGFITMLFNEEKRAIHDLLSGTIVVRQF